MRKVPFKAKTALASFVLGKLLGSFMGAIARKTCGDAMSRDNIATFLATAGLGACLRTFLPWSLPSEA